MTNYEKYIKGNDELIKKCIPDGIAFDRKNNKACACDEISCSECAFGNGECGNIDEWLDKEWIDPDEIKEGDKVRITNIGKCYTTFTEWVTKYIDDKKLIAGYSYDSLPDITKIYVAIKVHHEKWRTMVYIQVASMFDESCYLIEMSGLSKYE